MITGAWDAIALSLVALAQSTFAPKLPRPLIVLGLACSAIQLVTGRALLARGKIGLWGLYVLSTPLLGLFAWEFVQMGRNRGNLDLLVGFGAVLGLWALIVRYFYVRREQFTGLWRSTS